MKVGTLCSGYEGFGLALGFDPVWVCEYEAAPSRVLAHHHPDAPNLGDLTAVDWSSVEPVDLICAGYPCQPFSHAGKREGTNDARHLWPYVADAVRALRPGLVFLENVAGHLSMGFGDVLGDLAEAGYDAQWCSVRASDIGAPHRRERVFVLAADTRRAGTGRDSRAVPRAAAESRRAGADVHATRDARGIAAADAAHNGLSRRGRARRGRTAVELGCDVQWGDYEPAIHRWEALTRPAPAPTDTKGRLSPRFVEWMMGLPDGWVCDVPDTNRTAQLKMLGNGIVPQQAAAAWHQLAHIERAVA